MKKQTAPRQPFSKKANKLWKAGDASGTEHFHFISPFWTTISLTVLRLGGVLGSDVVHSPSFCLVFFSQASDPNGKLYFNRFQSFNVSFKETWELRMQAQFFLVALGYNNTKELQLAILLCSLHKPYVQKVSYSELQYFTQCIIHRYFHKPESWRKTTDPISFKMWLLKEEIGNSVMSVLCHTQIVSWIISWRTFLHQGE